MKVFKISLVSVAAVLAIACFALEWFVNAGVAELQQTVSAQRGAFFRLKALALENSQTAIKNDDIWRAREANGQSEVKILVGNIDERDALIAQRDRTIADRDQAIAALKADKARSRAAYVTTGGYVPRQPLSTASGDDTTSPPPVSLEAVRAAAVSRAENYFRFERLGSSPTLAIDVKIETDEPEPIDGYLGEYHVRGIGHVSWYDSRGSFNNAARKFEVRVQSVGGSARATDFNLRY
jgi:hypothetical protein